MLGRGCGSRGGSRLAALLSTTTAANSSTAMATAANVPRKTLLVLGEEWDRLPEQFRQCLAKQEAAAPPVHPALAVPPRLYLHLVPGMRRSAGELAKPGKAYVLGPKLIVSDGSAFLQSLSRSR